MIASIGLSIALQEAMRLQSSGREQWLPPIYADSNPPARFRRLSGERHPHASDHRAVERHTHSHALFGARRVPRPDACGGPVRRTATWRAVRQSTSNRVMSWTAATAAAFRRRLGMDHRHRLWRGQFLYGPGARLQGTVRLDHRRLRHDRRRHCRRHSCWPASRPCGRPSSRSSIATSRCSRSSSWSSCSNPTDYWASPAGATANCRCHHEGSLSGLILALSLALSGCGEDTPPPYLEFAGGGFIFNYRNAEAFYGFVAKPKRRLPDGATIEATLRHAGGRRAFRHHRESRARARCNIASRRPSLTGIEKSRDYKAVMRLIEARRQGTRAL